jgi:hypothetical protein
MLKLKNKHHLELPHFSFSIPHQMQLSPVVADDDELASAINNDPIDHDNNWVLGDPDTQELEKYWQKVERDLKSDPEWVDFSNN